MPITHGLVVFTNFPLLVKITVKQNYGRENDK